MEKVLVLMSTYNGEPWLREQLISIFNQTDVDINVLVRDDGSSDNTVKILDEFSENNRLKWYKGANLGPAKSFLELFREAHKFYDLDTISYFSLSDQDDLWDVCKISTACGKLHDEDGDLYVGAVEIMKEGYNNQRVIMPKRICIVESLVRECGLGCTMVLSKRLFNLIKRYTPNYLIMHDMWIGQVCLAVGYRIITDDNPYMSYRIHENNACGTAVSSGEKVSKHVKNLMKSKKKQCIGISKNICAGYSDMLTEKNRDILYAFSKLRGMSRTTRIFGYAVRSRFSNDYRKTVFLFMTLLGRI